VKAHEANLGSALQSAGLPFFRAPVLQVVRYWVIASLGRFWTHRIITVPGAPITRTGPYRYVAHPNYAVTVIETFVLPLAFGALALAVIMTSLCWVVLGTKIRLEGEALSSRRV
jgi:methyltransferase